MSLISYKNVNKYYGDYHALRQINLEIEPGHLLDQVNQHLLEQ